MHVMKAGFFMAKATWYFHFLRSDKQILWEFQQKNISIYNETTIVLMTLVSITISYICCTQRMFSQ